MPKVTGNELRSAKPRLLLDCIQDKNVRGRFHVNPYVSDVDLGWDECLREGFDPDGRTGLGPVYWRVVMRAGEEFYLSTYTATREHVMERWGSAGLAYCDPITGMAMARVETRRARQ